MELTNTRRGRLPSQRIPESRFVDGDRKSMFVFLNPHRLKPFRHAFGIAEFTAFANLGAAGNRIPSDLRPFDFRLGSHFC